MAATKEIPNLAVQVQEKLKMSRDQATSWIESLGTPTEVCDIYNQAVRDLYWLEKGAKSLVIIGQSGISYCLAEADKNEPLNQERALALRAQAKTIAYNLAANTWPGWGDEGVTIATADIKAGLQAAHLNLKLAFDLKKPADKIASAYWLLSALQLATGQFSESLVAISESDVYAQKTSDKLALAYNEGFRGLILQVSGNHDGQQVYDSGISSLKAFSNDEANGLITQLETAKKIFVK